MSEGSSPKAPQNAPEPKGNEPGEGQGAGEETQQELLSTLERLEIDSPERIEGLAQAGQQVGQLTALLSDARNEITRLQMMNNQLQSQSPVQPQHQQHQPEGEPPPQQPASDNLEARMWNVLDRYMGHYTQSQQQQAMRANAEYEAVSRHPDFKVVGKVFDQHITKPQVQQALMNGQTTLQMEFANVRGDFMKNLALKSKDAIVGRQPGAQNPPHIEGPGQPAQPSPASVPRDVDADRAKRIAQVRENTTGSDSDIENLMKELLPDGDPFLVPKANPFVPRR